MFCVIKPVVLLLLSACFYDLILSHGVRSGFPRTMTSFRVQLPEKFDFSRQEEWPKWSRRFERFRQASGLAKEEEESQINMLIYAMGDQGDDILNSFKLSTCTTQLKQYHTVKTKFDEDFVVRGQSEQSSINSTKKKARQLTHSSQHCMRSPNTVILAP